MSVAAPIFPCRSKRRPGISRRNRLGLLFGLILCGFIGMELALRADESDPIINLFIQKGFITEAEAAKARAEIAAMRTTNNLNALPTQSESKWKLDPGLNSIQLFGDLRLRYENRTATAPDNGEINISSLRYSVRFGLKGVVFDDFYYGLRLDTSANPRSPWVSMGTSSSGVPYYGPYGKSTAGIGIGQVYLGWRAADWLELTAGKMANPLYTTTMVWDNDLNPEGLAERLRYKVGDTEFFANFGQFVYQDVNPKNASGGLGFNGLIGQETSGIFQLAWQAGFQHKFTTNTSAKVAATIYKYYGLKRSSTTSSSSLSPYFGDPFVGEGAYLGPGSGTVNGGSGYGTSSTLPGYSSLSFPLNQVGLNDLLVLEFPWEFNFKLNSELDARVFGNFAYNLEGSDRARAAANGYAAWIASQPTTPSIQPFAPQTQENKAYQVGVALGSKTGWAARHPWEIQAYWQHTEQYALDPNLLDSDSFEGRGNLQGINIQLSFGLTPNLITSLRYGNATRINKTIGTGGSNLSIPQMNPINRFELWQLDLSFKF